MVALSLAGCEPTLHSSYPTAPRYPPNALAPRPPMGWNSWNRFYCDVNESLIRQTARALVTSGMADAGYQTVVLDDCWQIGRAADGSLQPDPLAFPHGIAALAAELHAEGLKLGIYTDVGPATCQNRPGSYGHEFQDAQTFASWGVDYLKEDWCHSDGLDPRAQYAQMHDALAQSGRDMVFSICEWGVDSPFEWAPQDGNLWRTSLDISDDWATMLRNLDLDARSAAVAGPGHWNDPDMLEVGNGGMTGPESRTHLGLWAMAAAPLIAGNDVRQMSASTLGLLTNPEVIAVDQDPAGVQGSVMAQPQPGLQVWSRPLSVPGTRAVALVNRTSASATVRFLPPDVGLAPGPVAVRDLWARADLGSLSDLAFPLAAHQSVLLRLTGAEPPPPTGTTPLNGLVLRHIADGAGEIGRDATPGGQPLSVAGSAFPTGLSVHAESAVHVWLGGGCSRFTANVGIEDQAAAQGGSVTFQLWADGQLLASTGILRQGDVASPLSATVTGAQELVLRVTGAGDSTAGDQADWADAELTCP